MYFQILIFPHGLHYYRSVDILETSVYPALILLSISLFIVRLLSRFPKDEKRLAYFGVSWFFIALMPMMNIVPLINEYSLILTSEHFLYFPFLGFILFALVILRQGLFLIFRNKWRQIASFVFALVALIFICIFLFW